MEKPLTVEAPAGLLAFLFAKWPGAKKTTVRNWLKHQAVLVNNIPVTQFDHPLAPGDTVAIRPGRVTPASSFVPGGIKIWFEDEHLIVVDKPANLLSIASRAEDERTVYYLLTDYLRGHREEARERAWIVHRLDKETSGLMVFAKTPEAKEFLQTHWDDATKYYEAVVDGTLPAPAGTLECDLDERNEFKVHVSKPGPHTRHAITHYEVLAGTRTRSLVRLRLDTGRRHQIRVQLADAGCPIAGDPKYNPRADATCRLALHATALEFPHPVTGKRMAFASPLPRVLAALVPERKR